MIIAARTIADRHTPRIVTRAGYCDHEERARASNYPLSRWYLRPLAGRLAARLANTRVRPWQVTLAGFTLAATAGAVIIANSLLLPVAALLTLGWWFCDRTDGQLARRQGTVSPLGAWLDGNLDELVDLGLHAAMAHVAAAQGSQHAWPLLLAFFFGKYLLMHGLADSPQVVNSLRELTDLPKTAFLPRASGDVLLATHRPSRRRRLAARADYFWLYRLPGNADVRAHLMILALATGWITTELAIIAVYYNLRWMVRFPLVIARARRPAA